MDASLLPWADEEPTVDQHTGAGGIASLHWQGKLRGLQFQSLAFQLDPSSSPDVLDAKGRQVQIPVCVPIIGEAVDERDVAEGLRNMSVLTAMAADPKASQRQLVATTGLSVGTLSRTLTNLAKRGFIEKGADDRWRLSRKGQREITSE